MRFWGWHLKTGRQSEHKGSEVTAPRQEVEQIALSCLRDTFDGEIRSQIYQINLVNRNNTWESKKIYIFPVCFVVIIWHLIESNLTVVNASSGGLILVVWTDIPRMPFCMVDTCTVGGVLASQYNQHIYTKMHFLASYKLNANDCKYYNTSTGVCNKYQVIPLKVCIVYSTVQRF